MPTHGEACLWHCFSMVLVVVATLSAHAEAQSTAGTVESAWRQAYVPANRPDVWPAGEWVPLLMTDYRQAAPFVEALSDDSLPSQQAWIESVEYVARVAGTELVDGQLTATVVNRAETLQVIGLGELSLAVSRLQWADSDQDVLWGTSLNDRLQLVTPPGGGQLQGTWSLAGTRQFEGTVFELRGLSGVMTQMRLELPPNHILTASDGVVLAPRSETDRAAGVWSVNLGQRQQVRLTISPAQSPSSTNRVIHESSTLYSLTLDGASVQAEFQLHNLPRQAQRIEFRVPPALQVESITLGGEAKLPFSREAKNRISVSIMGVEGERRTLLRLRGQIPFTRRPRWMLPRVMIQGGTGLSAVVRLNVARPLELKAFEAPGYRLVASQSDGVTGDHLEFEEYEAGAQLQVTVDLPRTDFTAQTLTHVRWDLIDPEMVTIIALRVRAGSASSIRVQVHEDWQIVRVEAADTSNGPGIARWVVEPDKQAAGALLIEFLEAVTPRQDAWLRLVGRQLDGHRATSWEVPMVVLPEARQQSAFFGIHPPREPSLTLNRDDSVEEIDVTELPSEWDEFIRWSDHDIDEAGQMVFLHAETCEATTKAALVPIADSRSDADAPPEKPMAEGGQIEPRDPAPLTSRSPSGVQGTSTDGRAVTIAGRLSGTTSVPVSNAETLVHRALLRVSALDLNESLLGIRLPSGAVLIRVQVDGRELSASDADQLSLISLPDDREVHEVLMDYRTTTASGWLSRQIEIPFPVWNGTTTQVEWTLQLPARTSVVKTSEPVVDASFMRRGWRERLLGPLGDAFSDGAGNREGLSQGAAGQLADGRLDRHLPAGSHKVRLVPPPGATAFKLTVWNQGVAQRLAWLVLVVALMVSLGARRLWDVAAQPWIALGVVALAVSAMIVPAYVAGLFGGALMGLWLGLIVPGELIRPTPLSEPVSSDSSVRSSHYLRTVPTVLFACLLTGALAADSPFDPARNTTADAGIDALIPVSPEGGAAEESPVVYVRSSSLHRLSNRGGAGTSLPRVLIRDAEYDIDRSDHQLLLRMRFEVLHRSGNVGPRRLFLPMRSVIISQDPEHCRVNGTAARLLPVRDGSGLVLEWDASDPNRPQMIDEEQAGSEDSSPTTKGSQPYDVAVVEIVSRPHAAVEDRDWVAVRIPQVAAARFVMSSESDLQVPNAQGARGPSQGTR